MGCICGNSICICIVVTFALFIIGITLLVVLLPNHDTNPRFSVEDASLRAYNLTADNRLFCIFDVRLIAHTRDSGFDYDSLDLEIRKGTHHKLADDAVAPFSQESLTNVTIHVEAVGLYVQLEDKIAAELRADVEAGVARVNMFMSGTSGSNVVGVACRDILVYFSGSNQKFPRLDCGVSVYDPNDN